MIVALATIWKWDSRHVSSRSLSASASMQAPVFIARLDHRPGSSAGRRRRGFSANVIRSNEGKIRRLVDANMIGIFMWIFDGRDSGGQRSLSPHRGVRNMRTSS